MKANELMVGDWVMDIIPVVIDAISNEDICTYRNEYGYVTANPSNLKPIPLTPEILEKNGFKKEQYCYQLKERLGGYMGQTTSSTTPIEIDYYEEGHCVIMNPHIGREYQGSISFVHELQHALRICGIDKEIVI